MGSVHACAFVPHSKWGFPLLPSLAVFFFSLLEMSVESEASFVPAAPATGDLSITLLGHTCPLCGCSGPPSLGTPLPLLSRTST